MYLSKFQLFNYKSFLNSGLLEFQPGINIIVGQNNSGKTALLEALSLNFSQGFIFQKVSKKRAFQIHNGFVWLMVLTFLKTYFQSYLKRE